MVMTFMKNQGRVFDKFCTYWMKILLEFVNAKLRREDVRFLKEVWCDDDIFLSGFPNKLCMQFSPSPPLYIIHLILLHLRAMIISGIFPP
jgi:hypothetical protein